MHKWRHRAQLLVLLLSLWPAPARADGLAEQYIQRAAARGDTADLAAQFATPEERSVSASFLEDLLAGDAAATVHRRGVRIVGAVVHGPLSLLNARVAFDVRLENCVFDSDVDFSHTEWLRDLSIKGSSFHGLDVSYAVVTGSLWLEHITTTGKAYLSFLHVGRALEAAGATFSDDSTLASFNSLVVGAYARLDDATFAGGSDWIVASIATNLYLAGAKFTNARAAAAFDRMRVGESIYAGTGVTFNGPVSFAGLRTGRDVSLANSVFNSTATADFSEMVVGGTCSVNRARFNGPVRFTSTSVHGLLTLDDARFDSPTSRPDFNLVIVDSVMRMVHTRFAAGFNLTGIHLKDDLNASGVIVNGAETVATLYRGVFDQTVAFDAATFSGQLDASHAHVGGVLNFGSAQFLSATATDLQSTTVGENAIFTDATFTAGLDMNGASIGSDGLFERITTKPGADFDLTDLVVGRDLSLEKAVMRGGLELQSAKIRGALMADEVQFLGEQAMVSFDSVDVRGMLNLTNSRFMGAVDFAALSVGDELNLTGVQFLNDNEDINFDGMKITASWGMRNAVFRGKLSCQLTSVGRDVDAREAKFLGKTVDFLQLHVSGDVTFEQAEFSAPPTFTNAFVGGYFNLASARIHGGAGTEFSLNSVHAGRFIDLDDAVIDARLNMVKAEMLSDLLMRRTRIGGGQALLTRLSVNGNCIIDRLASTGLDLSDGLFYNLDVRNLSFDQEHDDLVLTRAVVQRNLLIDSVSARSIVGNALRVAGTAALHDLSVKGQLSLDSSVFDSLEIREADKWRMPQDALRWHAIVFREITAGGGLTDQQWLIDLLERSAYSPATYLAFQQYFDRLGLPVAERNVFVNYRRRAARDGGLSLSTVWSKLLDRFVLFGKSPQRAFGYALIFVLTGMLVFDRSRMMPQKPEYESYHYSPVWYSLDRLIPFADLGTKNVWQPRQSSRLARNYVRLHIIIGYLLFTIGLAAISGLVK
jgi:hypothetical protein